MKNYFRFIVCQTKNTSLKIKYMLIFLGTFFSFTNCISQNNSENNQPNIIVIMADDLGYSDLGCYGGEIHTPTLDKMAHEGIRFPNTYNAGMCVISRSAMLTGTWWPRAGYGAKNGENIAQKLKKEGYRTGLIGKWHLDGKPNDKGFDYFFGFLSGFSSYFKGGKDYRINKEVFKDFNDDFYSTDAFSEQAVQFVKSSLQPEKQPFFLYLSYQSPHNPLQASKEEIMKYRGTYLKGWQSIRDSRIKKQKKIGIIRPDVPIPEYPVNLPDWDTLTDAQKDLEDLRMSVYAAMVERMDKGIGKLMETLKATHQDQNTLIIFLSDNGTDSFSVMDSVMLKRGLLPGDDGSNYQLGTGWAYASVSPLRLYKISQHSGGVKTGAIVRWPNGVANANTIRYENLNLVDFMPTFMELAQSNKQVATNQKLAGQSFIPLLKKESWMRKSPMYFQFMDNRAIRTDQWSMIEVDGNGWELYDVKKDPLETKDLSQLNKDIVTELESKWLNWWKTESGNESYQPESTSESPHYKAQGDRGSGEHYLPSAMPERLKGKYTID